MPQGIAKKENGFCIEDFESFDDIPSDVILPYPNRDYFNKPFPRLYSPVQDIQFEWLENYNYEIPPNLNIKYKGILIDSNYKAHIKKVLEYVIEYSNFTALDVQKKYTTYLENELQKKENIILKLKREKELELDKAKSNYEVWEKAYNALLEKIK